MKVLNHLPERIDAAGMLARHVCDRVRRALTAAQRARHAIAAPREWDAYRSRLVARFRAAFPEELFEMRGRAVKAEPVARFDREGYALETLRFESMWGWQANAHVCIPAGKGPWPAVVVPCGHAPKTLADHQVPPVVLARHGLVSILFDPPGMGEKSTGNDHFHQGTACLLTGLWSETFFIMDALRAIDYLAGRADVDLSMGVGMTGVSGGGETTMGCVLLDDRVRCIAPVCCTGALRVLGAEELYTSCPETIGPGLFAAGIDVPDKLALAAPTPCLAVSGELDELYHRKLVGETLADARRSYEMLGVPERFAHYEQRGVGHVYSVEMATEVALWMRRWLLGESNPKRVDVGDPAKLVESDATLASHPDGSRNMQTINAERADGMARSVKSVGRAMEELGAVEAVAPRKVVGAEWARVWWHRIERVAMETEAGVWVPALAAMDTRMPGAQASILWVDDREKWTALQDEPLLQQASGFLRREAAEAYAHVLAIDARGWGETKPEHVHYDLAGWNDVNRICSYMSIALGRPMVAQRVHDTLSALAWWREREEVDARRVVLGGHGAGAMVALLAALIDGAAAGFIGLRMLGSFRSLTRAPLFPWPQDVVVPGLLKHADVAELLAAFARPALLIEPLDAMRKPLTNGDAFAENVTFDEAVLPWLARVRA